MKLYTKRGDDGGTDLFGGGRVGKDSSRVEAYGDVDELNSVIGVALAACRHEAIGAVLRALQARLFELGADLATPRREGKADVVARVGPEQVAEAEGWIDAAWAPLPPMKNFVLPGGTELAARLHVARSVCRRAERRCVALLRDEPMVGRDAVIYINRLSDLLFTLARRANQLDGVGDVPWVSGR
ncbi:MAG: cob(I)yrinic acid a,c-diamide adenosyltransferase [Planctomycetes bacterium]|nr:cob(I)yrinic acid a,c-diamide adenosyltransferase [Planctomycetota bacterium]